MTRMQIYVDRDMLRQNFKLVAYHREAERITVISKIEMTSYPAGEQPHSSEIPGIEIDAAGAQSLIDSLWDAGVRPMKGSGSAGSFEAQGKHLEDMRALVFERKKP